MFNKWIKEFVSPQSKKEVIVVNPSSSVVVGPSPILVEPKTRIRIEPTNSIQVIPLRRGAWDEKGWTYHRNNGYRLYRGYYEVTSGMNKQPYRYQGKIEVANRDITPYIASPPISIKDHPKGPCFSRSTGDWFRVHWHSPPDNVDDAILYIEKLLSEVLN